MAMQKIAIRKERRGEWDVYHLSGAITEEASIHLLQLYDDAAKKCVFNFKDCQMINSSGIRAWILFLRDFQQDREIELEECAPIVVAQINMLPSFIQKAKLKSVYIPYVCEKCDAEQAVLFNGPNYPASNEEAKPARCKKCQGTAHVSDEDEFFAFVGR